MKRKASQDLAEQSNESTSEFITTTIDPDGDFRLVFDSVAFIVSRHVLCLSSSVFRAMLGKDSRFLEGNRGELHVHDDNADDMNILLLIIHLQTHRVPLEVSFGQLDGLALICDKYDMKRSLGAFPQMWAQPYTAKIDAPGFERLLFIAYVFELGSLFKRVTKSLIFRTKIDADTGELLGAEGDDFSERVPESILCEYVDQDNCCNIENI